MSLRSRVLGCRLDTCGASTSTMAALSRVRLAAGLAAQLIATLGISTAAGQKGGLVHCFEIALPGIEWVQDRQDASELGLRP